MGPMPSEFDAPRRLHPVSLIFKLAAAARTYAFPAIAIFLGGSGSGDDRWRLLGALMFVPAVLDAISEYLTYRYVYAPDELIVRWGLFFKNERHIPYSRIQNIDARQNLVHRAFGVFSVWIETGSGSGAEAVLNVLPESALNEMRAHVFAQRAMVAAPEDGTASAHSVAGEQPAESEDVLLHLGPRELMICGLVRGRGLLLLGAMAGVAFEMGIADRVADRVEHAEPTGPVARTLQSLVERGALDLLLIALIVIAFMAVLLVLRVMSMIYTVQKLWEFTLVRSGGELRMTYGSFTRVKGTIPLRRIQAVAAREGPLHRLFRMTSVRADTAGGEANQQIAGIREWLAPIMRRDEMRAFVRTLLPAAEIDQVDWQPAHPRAARRAAFRSAVIGLVLTMPVVWYFGVKGFAGVPVALLAAWLLGKKEAAHLGHAIDGELFYFRSGWFWRQMTVAPLDKVQAVSVGESPFDRRHAMASLVVDTAGAAGAPHRLKVPFLDRNVATALADIIAARAAQSALSW